MNKQKISSKVTFVLGVLSVFALIMMFLSLADIADGGEDLKLEWYIAGISMMVMAAFIISTFVTLSLFKNKV